MAKIKIKCTITQEVITIIADKREFSPEATSVDRFKYMAKISHGQYNKICHAVGGCPEHWILTESGVTYSGPDMEVWRQDVDLDVDNGDKWIFWGLVS